MLCNWSEYLQRWEREEGPRPFASSIKSGQRGALSREGGSRSENAQSQEVRGCKARGRKQDYRAKVRTKKKPPNSVPQRSVVSLDEVILALKGGSGC